jgi:23S rRNA (cytidine1920-2'-O)/16S rRNA (cytidine1409-2'-O)-methyltransferase
VPSREQALDAVASGRVLVAGAPAAKAARLVAPGEPIVVTGPRPRYVGRGGEKLQAALDHFGVPVAGRRALDVGASTGGFTDCLLQGGAEQVVAVDVGRAQLHERLRADARVDSLERTDIRGLSLDRVGGCPFELIVVDLAFISLRSVAGAVLGPLAAPGADVLTLIKPQFEAGRRHVSAGRGVVRDPRVWAGALESVYGAVAGHEAAMMGIMVSPLTGADGNVEFFAHVLAHQPSAGTEPPDFPAVALEASRRHGPGA